MVVIQIGNESGTENVGEASSSNGYNIGIHRTRRHVRPRHVAGHRVACQVHFWTRGSIWRQHPTYHNVRAGISVQHGTWRGELTVMIAALALICIVCVAGSIALKLKKSTKVLT